MKFTGLYSIIIGTLMIMQWCFFIFTGKVPELQIEPIRITFHLVSEGLTALALILSGIGLLGKRRWGRDTALIALGMLLYTTIVSPGYFAQQGEWMLVGMFVVILALTLVCLWLLSSKKLPNDSSM